PLARDAVPPGAGTRRIAGGRGKSGPRGTPGAVSRCLACLHPAADRRRVLVRVSRDLAPTAQAAPPRGRARCRDDLYSCGCRGAGRYTARRSTASGTPASRGLIMRIRRFRSVVSAVLALALLVPNGFVAVRPAGAQAPTGYGAPM